MFTLFIRESDNYITGYGDFSSTEDRDNYLEANNINKYVDLRVSLDKVIPNSKYYDSIYGYMYIWNESEGKVEFSPENGKEAIVRYNLEKEISELEEYLKDTDWYAIREAETGEKSPGEVKEKRAAARLKISEDRVKLSGLD